MRKKALPFPIPQILSLRRKKRITFALSKVVIKSNMNILDVGCGHNGRSFEDFIPTNWNVVGIDLLEPEDVNHTFPNFHYYKQDAQDLSKFDDNQFDLAVSIGLMEHITNKESFRKAALEIRRVSKQYIIIVPYRYAWIEPHYIFPFFPVYPYSLKLKLVKLFNLENQKEQIIRDDQTINKYIWWPSNSDYKKEFPEANIYLTPTLETIAIIKKENNR